MKKGLLLSLIIAESFFFNSFSQRNDNVVDEVIWIVGDDAILRSEVEQAIIETKQQGIEIPGNAYCVIAEKLAVDKLFLHQAQIDSLSPGESGVSNEVEMRINYFISQIGSKEKLEEYLKIGIPEFREKLRESVRNQEMIRSEKQKLVKEIKTTPSEVRRYFNQLSKDSIPTVPAEVEVQIISFEPPVSRDEINRIKEKLRDLSDRVISGKSDFSFLARLYSEDAESAKKGGELGFKGKAVLSADFAAVAFNLTDPKKVSRIFQDEYGYHIIQLIEKRGDLVNCRQILLKPHISSSEENKAIHILDSIANEIRANKITFEQAVINYSEDKNTAMNTGLMLNKTSNTSKFSYKELPPEVGKAVYSMNVGEISKPFLIMEEATNKEIVAIVKLKSKIDNHKANLTDDYQFIKGICEDKLKDDFLKSWIIKKQKETYISIDPKWQNCNFEYPGWAKK